jgi:orotidine-5'-phosphate decarboxylase
MRAKLPHAWILVPGFGAQGASAADTRAAARADGTGALVVSARGATFPDGPWVGDPVDVIRARIDATIRELGGAWSS